MFSEKTSKQCFQVSFIWLTALISHFLFIFQAYSADLEAWLGCPQKERSRCKICELYRDHYERCPFTRIGLHIFKRCTTLLNIFFSECNWVWCFCLFLCILHCCRASHELQTSSLPWFAEKDIYWDHESKNPPRGLELINSLSYFYWISFEIVEKETLTVLLRKMLVLLNMLLVRMRTL